MDVLGNALSCGPSAFYQSLRYILVWHLLLILGLPTWLYVLWLYCASVRPDWSGDDGSVPRYILLQAGEAESMHVLGRSCTTAVPARDSPLPSVNRDLAIGSGPGQLRFMAICHYHYYLHI